MKPRRQSSKLTPTPEGFLYSRRKHLGRFDRTSSHHKSICIASGEASFPEIASRQHVREICGVVDRALADAGATWSDLDALAVTEGPGLIGSLLVGVSFAKSAAWALDKPLVAVNHLAGHIESIWLEHGPIPLPAVVLVVSGGHTSLYLVEREGEYRLLGRTRDDAAGEAYDKVAKLVGLGYPGGPIIDRLAAQGDDEAIRWPGTRLTNPDRNAPARDGRFDFSFSGLKTAVLRHVRERQAAVGLDVFPPGEVADLAASFQTTRRRDAGGQDLRRGAMARRAIDWHRRWRVGELTTPCRGRRARDGRLNCQSIFRALRSRPTTPR